MGSSTFYSPCIKNFLHILRSTSAKKVWHVEFKMYIKGWSHLIIISYDRKINAVKLSVILKTYWKINTLYYVFNLKNKHIRSAFKCIKSEQLNNPK